MILEPTTVLTDYALGALGLVLGLRLWRSARSGDSGRRLWAGMLFAMAAAAFAGGTAHGWADRSSPAATWILWRLTAWSIGIACVSITASIARFAFRPRVSRWVTVLFAGQFLVYGVWMIYHEDFVWVIFEYIPAMIFVACVALWQWLARDWRGGPWTVAGVLVSFAAAGVQLSGFSLHQHFNHNDLYHVVQMLGTYLIYRGGDMLPPASES